MPVTTTLDLDRRWALITLDRRECGNALDAPTVDALTDAIAAASTMHDIDTIVLCGSGRNFCTGFDLSDLDAASDGDLLLRFVRAELMLDAVWSSPKRTVALVQGRAWGAGADLVVACDVRIAAPGATFRFPGPAFGLVLGSRRLAERIGADAARQVTCTQATVDTERARAVGIVSEVGPVELGEVARRLPPLAVDAATLAAIHAATRRNAPDTDLANLVRSAARPGLGDRLRRYRRSTTVT